MQKYCENLLKIEVKYTQTYTSLESGTMWHPKRDHHSVPPIQELQTQEYNNIID